MHTAAQAVYFRRVHEERRRQADGAAGGDRLQALVLPQQPLRGAGGRSVCRAVARHRAVTDERMTIPKIIHYCFGMAEDFGGKEWSLVHHVCLASAVARIRPEKVYFYYAHEPRTAWWELSRELVTPVRITAPAVVSAYATPSCWQRPARYS